MTLAKDLKNGDKIIYDNLKLKIQNIEFSKIGKLGKQKCRIEAVTEKNEKKVFITTTDEDVQLQSN